MKNQLPNKTEFLAWAAKAQLFADAALAYANALPDEDGGVQTLDDGPTNPPSPPPPPPKNN